MTGDSLVGQQLGPFSIVAETGRGGMGIVYRAYQPSLAREVALKVLPRWVAAQLGFAARFVSEARAAARLHHPNIVTVHDVGEADGWQYIVMQLLRGQTLEALVRREGALPPGRVLRIAEQIASALDFAHARGIVHRDVKPANIIVGDGDRATLTDFGIARIAEHTIHRTLTGSILGTPEYMAPEQAEGKPATSAADVYAFACVVFELLAGRPPFEADTPMGVLMQHVRTPPPRISPSGAGLPSTLDPVFRRALAKDPGARHASCGEFVRAAAAALQGRGSAGAGGSRSVPMVVGAAAVAIAVMGIAVVMASSGGRPEPPASPVAAPPTATSVIAAPTVVPPTPTRETPPTQTPRRLPTALPPAAAAPPTAVPTVGPTGSLVFVRGNASGGKDLFVMDVAANRALPRSLTSASKTWNWAPAASCDGQSLAFPSGTPGKSDIIVMNANGSGRRVIASSGAITFGSPWFMPDGSVGFNGSSGDSWEIYRASLSGSAPNAITSTPDIDGTRIPSWPCRSGRLAITGKQPGNTQFSVFVQSPTGSFQLVSPVGSEGYGPAWSPDGSRLAFQSGSGALRGIVTVAPDGSDARSLAVPSAGSWARAPVWSPDGRWIAYVSGTSGDDGDAYVVSAAGGGTPRQLTFDGNTYDWRLAWLP